MMGNPEMVRQFVAIYIQQSPIDFQALEQSLEKGNIKTIGDSAHHIKPTMEYIGASSLRLSFQELEDMSRTNVTLELIRQKFEEIKPQFQEMMEELEYFSFTIESSLNA